MSKAMTLQDLIESVMKSPSGDYPNIEVMIQTHFGNVVPVDVLFQKSIVSGKIVMVVRTRPIQ